MFSDVQTVVTWLFSELAKLTNIIWTSWGWVGVSIIGLSLMRKVIDTFKKIL